MADKFNDKHYGKYWNDLEKNMKKKASGITRASASADKSARSVSKRSGRAYRVIRLRYSRIALVLALIVGIAAVMITVGNRSLPDSDRKSSGSDTAVSQNADSQKSDVAKSVSFRFTKETQDLPASNDAQYGIVIDLESGKVVAERNAQERAYPASTTKIMTLLIAVENITDYSDTFTMSLAITDPLFEQEASVAGFLKDEVISMTDLLYGTILPSGADAAMALAIKIAGSEQGFVSLMNRKVKELGLKHTHFTNVTGLFDEDNYTTVYDMAVILYAAMQNELCKKVLSTYQYTTASTPQHPDGILLSSTLFSYMYGTEPETATILGGKTGFVNESGYCIASFGENNETHRQYLAVTFKNSARWPAFYGQIDLYKQFAH